MMEQNSPMSDGSSQDRGTIAELVEQAFQYRGDVTVGMIGGKAVTGYLFNRNARCEEPFVQLFETGTGHEITVLYQSISQIRFTGRDAAVTSARHFEDFKRQ